MRTNIMAFHGRNMAFNLQGVGSNFAINGLAFHRPALKRPALNELP